MRPLSPEYVCALVVTYFPDAGLAERLAALAQQVAHIIVVDNGSAAQQLAALAGLADAQEVTLIANERNVGVAAAQNQGLQTALAVGFHWVLTLDQDSVPDREMVCEQLASLARHPTPDCVALVAPTLYLPSLPENRSEWRWVRPHPVLPLLFERVSGGASDRDDITFTISSGALLSLDAYAALGPLRTDYFIDYVDTEYCLRARASGYLILMSARATLAHHLGEMREVAVTGIPLRPRFHSASRVYFQYRNRIPTLRRYGATFPHWFLYDILASLFNLVKIIIVEDRRRAKLRACALGTWHGLIGRMGPR